VEGLARRSPLDACRGWQAAGLGNSVPEAEEPESTQVVDLMARLQESLEMGKKRHAKAKSGTKRASRRKSA